MPHSPLLRSAAADELIGLFERWFNLHSAPDATDARPPTQTPVAPLEFTGHDGRIWAYTRRTGWLVRAPDEAPGEQAAAESSHHHSHRQPLLREQEQESPWLPLLDERRSPGRAPFFDEVQAESVNLGERMAYLRSLVTAPQDSEEPGFSEDQRAALRMDTRVVDALEAIEEAELGASTYGDREATEDLVADSTETASPTFIHSWAGREWRPWRRANWQAAVDDLEDLAVQARESRPPAADPVPEAVYTDSSEDEEEEEDEVRLADNSSGSDESDSEEEGRRRRRRRGGWAAREMRRVERRVRDRILGRTQAPRNLRSERMARNRAQVRASFERLRAEVPAPAPECIRVRGQSRAVAPLQFAVDPAATEALLREGSAIEIDDLADLVAIQDIWLTSMDSISDPLRMLSLCKAHLSSQVERLQSLVDRELISEGDYLKWMNLFKFAYDKTVQAHTSWVART